MIFDKEGDLDLSKLEDAIQEHIQEKIKDSLNDSHLWYSDWQEPEDYEDDIQVYGDSDKDYFGHALLISLHDKDWEHLKTFNLTKELLDLFDRGHEWMYIPDLELLPSKLEYIARALRKRFKEEEKRFKEEESDENNSLEKL